MDVTFGRPQLLLALWAIVPLAIVLALAIRARRRAGERFAEPHLLARLVPAAAERRMLVRGVVALCGLLALGIAAARPRYGTWFEQVTRRGADLVAILDVSRSMLSQDVQPNRLARAKAYVRDLVERVQGDRVGIVAFAGKAVPVCPLTVDRAFFDNVLADLGPDSVPRGGTVIGDAIRAGLDMLGNETDRDRAFLLITDGEDQDSFPLEAAKAARERGVKIFTVGVGDPTQGARIPVDSESAVGERTWLKHEGAEVWSKLDESTLEKIAIETGGAYVPSRTGTYDLGDVYDRYLKDLRAGESATDERRRERERFQWFAGAGLALLLLAEMIARPRRVPGNGAALALAVALVGFASEARADETPASQPAAATPIAAPSAPTARDATRAAELHNEAIRRLEAGEVDDAAAKLAEAAKLDPIDARIAFAQGFAAQRQGDATSAQNDYDRAASAADPTATARSRYNLGTLAVESLKQALGEHAEDAAGDARTKALADIDGAVAQFRAALRIDPALADARTNIEELRQYQKWLSDAWKRKDREKNAQGKTLPKLLAEFADRQRAGNRDLAAHGALAAGAERSDALAKDATTQGALAEDLGVLPAKAEEFVTEYAKQMQSTHPPAAKSSGADDPIATLRERLEMVLTETIDLAKNAATAAREARLADADAAEKQALAHLEDTWRGVAQLPEFVERMHGIEQDLVKRTEPLAAEAASRPAQDALASSWLVEDQSRIAALAPSLATKAKALAQQLPEAPASAPASAPAGPAGPAGTDPQAEQRDAQIARLREATKKAIENAPKIESLGKRAASELGEPSFPAALLDEREIVRLLEEIFPQDKQDQNDQKDQKDQQDQKNSGDQDRKDQQDKDDQKKQDPQQDGKDSKPKDEKKQDPQQDDAKPNDPKSDPKQKDKDDQKKPSEADAKNVPLTPEQAKELAQKAAQREKEFKEKKKALARLLAAPVPVDRDW